MRRFVAAVIVALFAFLNAMDGVCCPDGCTQEQASSSLPHKPEPTDGLCVLCVGGIESSVRQELSPCSSVIDCTGPPPLARRLDAPSDPLDHPPRA